MSLLKVTKRCIQNEKYASWKALLESCLDDITELEEEIFPESGIDEFYPLPRDVFKALELTPLDKVKVVIIGQDPYHGTCTLKGTAETGEGSKVVPQAMGLSFSVPKGAAIPPSLRNIFTELKSNIDNFSPNGPTHGDLTYWAQQGVLLLNQCLTVTPGQPGSHGAVWMFFLKKVVEAVKAKNSQCIWVLWGQQAQKLEMMINSFNILTAAHPSPLSVNKGFYGCQHFSKINALLIKQKKTPIDWNVDPPEEDDTLVESEEMIIKIHKPKVKYLKPKPENKKTKTVTPAAIKSPIVGESDSDVEIPDVPVLDSE